MRFNKVILSYGFEMINEDHCVYLRKEKGKFVILSLYVDDMLIAGSDIKSDRSQKLAFITI